jgi:FkbM family methyltransferase
VIALLGIGALGQKLYFQLKKQDIKVDFLLDNHKSGEIFDEMEMRSPIEIEDTHKSQTTVIISTFKQELQKNELNELTISILLLGFKEVLNIQQAINRFNLDFEYFYIGKFDNQRREVKEVLNLLSDDVSKKVFQAHIDFRTHGNIDILHQNLSQEDQYAPDFFVQHVHSLEKSLRVIDCGACFGDLLNSALDRSIDVGEYIAFEPDVNNREILITTLRQRKLNSIIMPLGVGDRELNLRFASGEGMASHFDENGTELIKIVSLDSLIVGEVDWIKMDIEGFEQEALLGATRILETFKPALAISLYHKPDDIIALPLYLSQYYSRFYIRQHGRYGFDLVLYCFN